MAKWDNKKLDKDIDDAELKGDEPPVPVTIQRKLTREETLRRYDRG